jgi:phytoene/squalene synthetase
VRFADEIVDTFHSFDKTFLLEQFKKETHDALARGISLNPVLNSFQQTVKEFNISIDLINSFFDSMEMDLTCSTYDENAYREYIYGSAEVVGLMCLQVFCEGKKELVDNLKAPAQALGAAFQKVNFLRDIKNDYNGLSRLYFPGCDFRNFSAWDKQKIEEDIERDFHNAFMGIKKLPLKARFGVYVAYKYYMSLFKKIRKLKPASVMEQRIRIPNFHKLMIVFQAGVKNQLRLF